MERNIDSFSDAPEALTVLSRPRTVEIPDYLRRIYWWTYIHPLAVKVFDHLWVVNLILLTQYNHMCRETLKEFDAAESGKILEVSCAYGNLMPKLAGQVKAGGGRLDIIDVVPIQLENAKRKMPEGVDVRFMQMNADDLQLPSASYDKVMIYFLLHEVPKTVRTKLLREAFRVVKPGGKVVLAEFAKPKWWNPFRYLWAVFLTIFEPFALDMWWNEIGEILPAETRSFPRRQTRYFGHLFQKTVVQRPEIP